MATFNINHAGVPNLLAVDDSYTLIEADYEACELLGYHTFNVLSNDNLGVSPTLITSIDTTLAVGLGTIQIAPDGLSVRVLHPFERNSDTYSFTYTITDAFARTDTATVNITVTIT